MIDWNPLETPHFTFAEMGCTCMNCDGSAKMDHGFMLRLQDIRDAVGPLSITSGYRCPDHPAEKRKDKPGAHQQGRAADIGTSNAAQRFKILEAALNSGMIGIGTAMSFIHVDDGHEYAARPAMWNYR